jgi:endonuclease-3
MLNPPIRKVLDILYDRYGRPEYSGPDDLLGTLVRTILSQNTTRQNTDRSFGRLIERFAGDWDRIAEAPVDAVVEAIKVGGLARQKAPRIQSILRDVREEHGAYSLEHLRELDVDEAQSYLESFKGVGPKTAKFTLMYAGGMSVFPMDTHILRLCERLGWTDPSDDSRQAHRFMEPRIPDGEHYGAHIVMIRHGRQTCHARNPDCPDCPLLDLCPHGQSVT